MIIFQDVSRVYGKGKRQCTALNGASFKIAQGDFVSIVGQSGAGKSTILRLLNREEIPTSGHILVNNQNIHKIRRRHLPRYRRLFGNIFQDFKLLPKKTAYENVAFAMEVAGMAPREIHRDVPQILSIVGLEAHADQYPDQLSGGEKQRVCTARALVFSPKILLADEPTGNLDEANTNEIIALLKKINEFGTTVLLATHDKDVVNGMKRRVITLQDGKIISDEKEGTYIL